MLTAPTGGLAAARPAVVSPSPGDTRVFARDQSGRLRQAIDQGEGFGKWDDLGQPSGGAIVSGIAASVAREGQFDIIVKAADGKLHRWNWGQTFGWNQLGIAAADTPAVVTYSAYQGENSSAAVAPSTNASCPSGRVFVALGPSRTILQADLNCIGDLNCVEYAEAPPPGDLVRTGMSNDNVIKATADGRLIYVKQTFVRDATSTNQNGRVRVVEQFWTSDDCGVTWRQRGRIDQLTFGVNVVPQCDGHPPGFDRVELYVDPFDGTVYATANLKNGCGGPEGSTNNLFRSDDFGQSWTRVNNQIPFGPPMKMTSTPAALFVFHCAGSTPTLLWSRDRGATFFRDTLDITANHACSTWAHQGPFGGGVGDGSEAITRIGHFAPNRDSVRVNFGIVPPCRAAGTCRVDQWVNIYTVRIDRRREQGVTANGQVDADWSREQTIGTAATNILQFSAIQPNDGTHTALYYWRELFGYQSIVSDNRFNLVTGNNPTIRVRYRAVRGANGFSTTGSATAFSYLFSTDAGWWGDYVYGAYYGNGNPGRYFVQWSQGMTLNGRQTPVIQSRIVNVAQDAGQVDQ